jgi:hypothetical protein
MRIYQNLDSDIDIISDGYKLKALEEYDGVITEVESKMIVKGDVNVDVGCGNALGGKNEDEEEGAGGEAPPEKVNDLIDHFQYQETGLDKAGVMAWMKEYGKKIADKLPADRQEKFKAGFKKFAGHLVKNLGEFTIYTPSDYSQEGTLIFSFWKQESDEAPHFWFLLDGLKSYKV